MAIPGASSASPVTDAGTTNLAASRALRWQQATITAIVPQTPRVKSFVFAPSHPFSFRAGQHVDVRLTAPDGYSTERSYSMASAPETRDSIELAIERLDDGEVSPFFHEVAVVGDEIELRGPIGGHFVWDIADGGPLLLLGGGSGVVPLMSMIRHRAAQGSTIPVLLFYSARSWDEIIFRNELIALDDRQDGFELVLRSRASEPGGNATTSVASILRSSPKCCRDCRKRRSTFSSAARMHSSGLQPIAPSPPALPAASFAPNATAADASLVGETWPLMLEAHAPCQRLLSPATARL
jgi:ferredoxin-NADP reductase